MSMNGILGDPEWDWSLFYFGSIGYPALPFTIYGLYIDYLLSGLFLWVGASFRCFLDFLIASIFPMFFGPLTSRLVRRRSSALINIISISLISVSRQV